MKKIILSLCLILVASSWGYSQAVSKSVGVNTDNPRAIFHIDAKEDNGTGNIPTNITDDVVIDNSGQVGIGKIDPTVKLDIKGGMRLVDGTHLSYMLVSKDNLGNTKWTRRPNSIITVGQINDNSGEIIKDAAARDLTTVPLTLSAGKWLVISKFVVKRISGSNLPNQNIWIYLKNETTNKFEGILGVTVEQDGSYIGTPQLAAIVDVPINTTYQYEIYGSTSNTGMGTTSDFQGSVFYALRLDEDTL
jgi:hypothetical protein